MDRVMASANTSIDTPAKRLLGQVLLDGEFILQQDLEKALAEQNHTNELLGEVLVRMGVVDPVEVCAAVSIQSDLASLDDAVKVAAGVRQCLGDLLLKAKRITREHLDDALEEQRQTGEKLGGLFVRRGLLTEKELDAVLTFQRYQERATPGSVKLRLGEILVATRQITREQLDAVLQHQKLTKKNIGELLLESGAVERHQVTQGLKLQEKLVTAALLAVMSLAGISGAQEISSGSIHAAPAVSRISVTAVVASRTTLKVIHQRPELVITGGDIARGYVDSPSASRVEVRSNDQVGYLMSFEGKEGASPMFSRVHVDGLRPGFQIDPGGGWIPLPHTRGMVTMELSYRFILSAHARPGTYPWPFAIKIRPL